MVEIKDVVVARQVQNRLGRAELDHGAVVGPTASDSVNVAERSPSSFTVKLAPLTSRMRSSASRGHVDVLENHPAATRRWDCIVNGIACIDNVFVALPALDVAMVTPGLPAAGVVSVVPVKLLVDVI